MKIHQLKQKQKLPITINEAWGFFSSPENLKKITPKYMGFDIVSGADRPTYPGQIIQYKVSPLLGIKTTWVTEITHVQDQQYFVDEQRFGPYALWHHKHFFYPISNGVLMEDIVDYKLPFGFIGNLLHSSVVRPKLNEIFNYRRMILTDLFGTYEE